MKATFAYLLRACVGEDESEEAWAYRNGLAPRTIRRCKVGPVMLRQSTLRKMARAMRQLGGTFQERMERISRAAGRP
jgi:hypothetical protein